MWEDIADWVGKLTPGDWAARVGTIVAALIGVVGLTIVLVVEARGRYRARVDDMLAVVISALAGRARDLREWTEDVVPSVRFTPDKFTASRQAAMDNWQREHRKSAPGGPLDADLQAAVEAAWLTGRRRRDRRCLAALADATFSLKRAVNPWQIDRTGRIAADIRRWRSGEVSGREFVRRMHTFRDEAVASGEAYEREQAEAAAEQKRKDDADREARIERVNQKIAARNAGSPD